VATGTQEDATSIASVVSLKKSCTSLAVWVRCAHAKETPSQADVAD
jgi:hypothetical protein